MNKRTLRVIHTADLHLGTTFRSIPDRGVADQLQGEHEQLMSRLVRAVNESEADVLMLAGDIFDSPQPEQRLVDRFVNSLKQITTAHVFICAGNHDPCLHESFWQTISWPERVHFFHPEGPHSVIIPELSLRVDGRSFADVYAREPLYPGAPELMGSTEDDGSTLDYRLLLLHGDVVTGGSPSDYNPIRMTDLLQGDYDYAALGHVHLPGFGKIGRGEALWRYPGAPQGRGFDELGVRGFWLGELTRSELAGGRRHLEQNWELIPATARPFLIHSIDVTEAETEPAVQELIERNLARWAQTSPELKQKEGLVRILLTGRPDLPRRIDKNYHLQQLSTLGWFYFELEDKTRPPYDPEKLRKEAGFNETLMEVVDGYRATNHVSEDALERALDLILTMEREVLDDHS